jgi:hypothetical protein
MDTQDVLNVIKTVWKAGNQPTTATEDDFEFLNSENRGIIKISPLEDKGKEALFRVEDLTVYKELPLKTASTLEGNNASYSGTDSTDTSATDTTQSTDPKITIKFKAQLTSRGLGRAEFINNRAALFLEYENTQVKVTSDMFRKVTPMQFTVVSYTIPQGETAAQYEIELTQITPNEEPTKDDKTSTETGVNANGFPVPKEGETPEQFIARQNSWANDSTVLNVNI